MRTIVVTCAEADAELYLKHLPTDALAQTALVTTTTPGRVLGAAYPETANWVIAGPSSVAEVRRRVATSTGEIEVLLGPDYGSLSYRRRFIQRRLLAPWTVPSGRRVDVVRIGGDGGVQSTMTGLSRRGLVMQTYPRDICLVASYLLVSVLSLPLGLLTTVWLTAHVIWTEAGAMLRGRRGRKR